MATPDTAPGASNTELPGFTIALKCANDPNIVRCLDSIDDDVNVHVAVTPNDTIEGILRERGVPYTLTPYGNIAGSAQVSIDGAPDDHVMIMDSDTWFEPGTIRQIREALQTSPLVKPRVHFLADTATSRFIANKRHLYTGSAGDAVNPGLAMRREEVRQAAGGYIFNPEVRWTEDADLNHRLKRAGLRAEYLPDAVIYHEPVSLRHDLRAAFLYGIGKRLSVEHTPTRIPTEEFPDFVLKGLKGVLPSRVIAKIREQGLTTTLYDRVWNAIYLAGYHAQKRTGKWALEAAAQDATTVTAVQ